MEQQIRTLGEVFPLIAAVVAIVVVVICALRWFRRSQAGAAPDASASAQYSYDEIRERYLEALKQTSMTHGLGIMLGGVSSC